MSRPDAEITLIVQPQFVSLLESWGVADRLRALPPRGAGYFAIFWRMRHDYPDVYLLFTNSLRGDLEAWFTRCPQRFGLVRPGRPRPLLTHRYCVPVDFDEKQHHQLELWENFLLHFGLNAAVERTPFSPPPAERGASLPIGLIAGSENTPEKRWPVAHWRALIEATPSRRFVLFGTAHDQPLTAEIARGFAAGRVSDLAGRTDLPAFAGHLRTCALLITNDTGGMHLANAAGVPLLALFGPTNPVRTSPVFIAPVRILQPPACPPTGGGALADLAPATVIGAMRELLGAPSPGV
jgi:ADP-heptose:LPS heptosyltransferase